MQQCVFTFMTQSRLPSSGIAIFQRRPELASLWLPYCHFVRDVSKSPALCFPSTTQRQLDFREPILDWVTKGVVVPVLDQPCFLSRLFAVPLPDNRHPRLIIDLSRLNEYIVSPPFSLDNHSTLAKLLSPPAFMASRHRRSVYACSDWSKLPSVPGFFVHGTTLLFSLLPFGLNAAPFIFTQVLAWLLQCLRARGISSSSWPTWTTLLSGTETRTHSWCRCSRWCASSRRLDSDWTSPSLIRT